VPLAQGKLVFVGVFLADFAPVAARVAGEEIQRALIGVFENGKRAFGGDDPSEGKKGGCSHGFAPFEFLISGFRFG
jgi:hypothetical protein